MIPEPSKELIKNCQNRDMESFKMLYRHYEKFIFGFCLRMLNNRQDTEDAVQTIFLNLFRGIANFNFKSRFTTYLISITRNVCYNMLKKQKHENGEFEHAKLIAGADTNFNHDLSHAISKLPARTRECFILFAVEGYPQVEIATILNIEVGTVKSLIFQARKKLVSWLSE